MMRIVGSIAAMAIFATTAGLVGLSGPAVAQQKTEKACQDEWRANRQANQAAGITEKAYVEKCRAGQALNQPSANQPSANRPSAQAPAAPGAPPPSSASRTTGAAPAAAPPAAANRTTGIGGPTGANQFSTEAQAKAQCGGDTVVWANLDSKVFHFAGNKNYGTTKRGAFMCERQATAEGIRAAKNEKQP